MTGTSPGGETADRDGLDAADPTGRSTPADTTGPADDDPPTVDVAVERIYDRADEVRTREVETALAKLDARGDLSPEDRAAIEGLADRLVARLIAVPERGLRAATADADEECDPAAVETALELFG